MYVSNFNIIQEDLNGNFNTLNGHEYRTEHDTLESAKLGIKDIIWQSIELDCLIGLCRVEVSHEHNGEWVDGDEFDIRVVKVVRTGEPSKYVKNTERNPLIQTVDKEKSVVIIEETGEPLLI